MKVGDLVKIVDPAHLAYLVDMPHPRYGALGMGVVTEYEGGVRCGVTLFTTQKKIYPLVKNVEVVSESG
jgi:hypothetical protein